jgi:hypothetical protein
VAIPKSTWPLILSGALRRIYAKYEVWELERNGVFGLRPVMNQLLARIIDAHGGMDRWNGCEKLDATSLSGGGLRLRTSIEFQGQRLGHRWYTIFVSFWYSRSAKVQLGGQGRTTAMNVRSGLVAACLAVATPAAAQTRGEVVTPNFEHAIPNIPGKSLIAVTVKPPPLTLVASSFSHPFQRSMPPCASIIRASN